MRKGDANEHPLLPTRLRSNARELRKTQIDVERLMWAILRGRRFGGFKFRRQHPLPPFILDFYCSELRLGVELDGGQHLEAERQTAERARTAALARRGVVLLRFSNREVLLETEAVLERLWEACVERAPSP